MAESACLVNQTVFYCWNKFAKKNRIFEYLLYNTNLKWWTGNILRIKPKIKFIFSTFRTDIVNFWYSIFFLAHWNFSQGSTDRSSSVRYLKKFLGPRPVRSTGLENFLVRTGSLGPRGVLFRSLIFGPWIPGFSFAWSLDKKGKFAQTRITKIDKNRIVFISPTAI